MIATRGEGEEGEKVNLKICLSRELKTPVSSMKGLSIDHYTKEDRYKFEEIFHYKYYVAVSFQFSPLKGL